MALGLHPCAKYQTRDLWARKQASYLKHITSDISWGVKEGLLARKQGEFWLIEIGLSNFNSLAKSQYSSKQLSSGLQKIQIQSPWSALPVDTTASFESCVTFLGVGTVFRKGETL